MALVAERAITWSYGNKGLKKRTERLESPGKKNKEKCISTNITDEEERMNEIIGNGRGENGLHTKS